MTVELEKHLRRASSVAIERASCCQGIIEPYPKSGLLLPSFILSSSSGVVSSSRVFHLQFFFFISFSLYCQTALSIACSILCRARGGASFEEFAGSRYPSGLVSHSLFFRELCNNHGRERPVSPPQQVNKGSTERTTERT